MCLEIELFGVAPGVASVHTALRLLRGPLPQVAAALDDPLGDRATSPLFWLSCEARSSVTLVLSGQGVACCSAATATTGYRPFAAPVWPGNLPWLLERGRAQAVLGDGETASGFPLLAGPGDRAQMQAVRPSGASSWEADTSA